MRRFLVILSLVLAPVSAGAQSISVRDIVELSRAGLGEEALLALIEVNRRVFPVDPETLKSLKAAGVPDSVILAMIRSGRTPAPPAPPVLDPLPVPAAAPAAQVVVIEHQRYEEPPVRVVAVPVPVYVPVRVHHRVDSDRHPDWRLPVAHPAKPVQPVYWGWGGKLRPDAWKPTAADVQKDARVPREPQRK
jgi:hypothetical protein